MSHSVTFSYGSYPITLSTGVIARQASSAVRVDAKDATVLVTLVVKDEVAPGADFFPLTVDYQERSYASGKIPGGFFKREGRPSEREILTSRLIDRALRPLFPEGFHHEIQITVTLMSYDPDVQPDILAMVGASAAVGLTGLPAATMLAARVGRIDDAWVLNPSLADIENSRLDLVVAGTDKSVLMVESEAKELSEAQMLEALAFAMQSWQQAHEEISRFVAQGKKEDFVWQAPQTEQSTQEWVQANFKQALQEAFAIADKLERGRTIKALAAEVKNAAAALLNAEGEAVHSAAAVAHAFEDVKSSVMRQMILDKECRIDGRDLVTVRPISIETGVLAKTHGSTLFTRGETQAIVVATLGTTDKDAQLIESPEGEQKDRFMLHYNFPPYCVGETGRMGSPKRREIGHGRLARRALQAVLPSQDAFPYVLRVVSEITESNGSSSMATVCGTSLALMDAGVPLRAPVAGIAMGLVKEGERFKVLSDILGDEDHLGDMDFKVAGTAQGITALQMDIKVQGITPEIMKQALAQAHGGRMHILDKMQQALQNPRELSANAPRLIRFPIPVDRIGEVIGRGGATIKGLSERFEATIEINDDGVITLAAPNKDLADAAQKAIETMLKDIEVGEIYDGQVVRLADFGAFVNLLPGKDGLLHISQIAHARVHNVADHLSVGDVVKVKVVEVDTQGRVKLSMKALIEVPAAPQTPA